jgi:peptidoglycan-associated lipoprotein
MRQTIVAWFAVLIVAFTMLAIGCGGEKPAVETEPELFPEPSPREEPRVEPPPKPVDIPKKEPLVLNTIYFDFDKSDLTAEARAVLAQNARRLEENPNSNIRIEGHCDERGTVEYNLALGERRAISARDYLINYGISADRVTIISYGKERPVDPRHSEEAWAQNRRAEFVILN